MLSKERIILSEEKRDSPALPTRNDLEDIRPTFVLFTSHIFHT